MQTDKDFIVIIKSLYPSLHTVEKKIAEFILTNTEIVVNMTVAQISKKIDVADSSIIRFCQKMGFDGFTQLKINIAKNLKKPEELIMQDISIKDSAYTITTKVIASSIRALQDTLKMLDEAALNQAVNVLTHAKKIEFYGVGTSAPIALDAYYRFMRIGLPAMAAIDPHIMRVSAGMLDTDCVAIGISHTGRTTDTLRALEIAKSHGAKTIGITSVLGSPICSASDIVLAVTPIETKIMKEAISSRFAHIALIDSLYAAVALNRYETVIEHLENMTELLNETRL